MLMRYLGRKWATPTCARKFFACVSSTARADVTPINVAASCMRMTPISALSTLFHIGSSKVTHITMRKYVSTKLVSNQMTV